MASCSGPRPPIGGLAALLLFVAGCGGEDWGYLEGKVKLNGTPVGPGSITLEPVDGTRAGSVGSFGEDGRYSIMSAGRKEGALPGEYRVLIHGGENFGEETGGPPPASKIPARYGDMASSDLRVTIEPGKKTLDFDLKP